ncbi:MAG: hypothetical protein QW478_10605 [Candidatus Micrarchaeaceae archaeon]
MINEKEQGLFAERPPKMDPNFNTMSENKYFVFCNQKAFEWATLKLFSP